MGIESMRHLLSLTLASAWTLQPCAQSPLDTWAEEHGVLGFSVSVATESGPNTTWTGGLRNVEAQLPVNAATTFRVASISKAAVAVGFFKMWGRTKQRKTRGSLPLSLLGITCSPNMAWWWAPYS